MEIKFGALILAYNQEQYIEYCIEAIYSYLDSIVIMYSEYPWIKYNPNARLQFRKQDRTLKIINNFPDNDRKIFTENGIWNSDEEMRNAAVRILEKIGIDWTFIIDADEFYPDGALSSLKTHITENQQEYSRKVLWARRINHFKRFDYIIDPEEDEGDPIEIAFPLNLGIKFIDRRIVGAPRVNLPENFVFHHFGYVLDDKRMWEKINTWGHANEIRKNWYKNVWLNWSPTSTNLCKRIKGRWKRTIKFDIEKLPKVLKKHPYYLELVNNE